MPDVHNKLNLGFLEVCYSYIISLLYTHTEQLLFNDPCQTYLDLESGRKIKNYVNVILRYVHFYKGFWKHDMYGSNFRKIVFIEL